MIKLFSNLVTSDMDVLNDKRESLIKSFKIVWKISELFFSGKEEESTQFRAVFRCPTSKLGKCRT